jgi:hypothetical protein
MRKKYIPLAVAALLVVLGVLVFVRQSVTSSASGACAPPTTIRTSQAKHPALGDYPGVPAIKPSMPGRVPAFTTADVRAYIHAHNFAPGIDDSKITRILFIPSSEAFTLMKGEQTGIADNEMVCYVEFANINITLNNVSRPVGAQPPFIRTGQIVYSATTGNVLVWGGIN